MKTFDSLIFDLDGTIWDAREAVAKARNSLAKKLDLPLPISTASDVQRSMGLTLEKVYEMSFSTISWEEYLKIRPQLEREMTDMILKGEASLFPEVETTLSFLSQRVPLFLVSNCSKSYLAAYFQWSGHQKYFKDALCNGENKLPKAENIRLIVQRNKLKHPVYIGDIAADQKAAREAGVAYIHADYGFGSPESESERISEFSQLKLLFS